MNTGTPEYTATANPQNVAHSSSEENTYNQVISDEDAASAELSMELILKLTPQQYEKRRAAIFSFLLEHARPGRAPGSAGR